MSKRMSYREGKPHLWTSRPEHGLGSSSLAADRENEGVCTVCRARVTIDPTNSIEYGHDGQCHHRDDSLPYRPQKNPHSDHVCPTCGRGDFGSETAMRIHHSCAHGESITDTLECDHCGDEFTSSNGSDQQYCSRECTNDARRELVEMECDHCGDVQEVLPSRAARRSYCSMECSSAAQRNRVELTCDVCGDDFEAVESELGRRKHCSTECQMASQRTRVTLSCRQCGDDFDVRQSRADIRLYCSKACSKLGKRDRVTLECKHCGDEFRELPSRADERQCCSMSCSAHYQGTFPRAPVAANSDADTGGVTSD